MTKRRIYLETKPLDEALGLWREALEKAGALMPLEGELVGPEDALGRVCAEAVYAKDSSPFSHSAAMDGVAVGSMDTAHASGRNPVRLKLGGQAVYVDTGNPLPSGMDAVIKVEDVEELDDGEIEIIKPAPPWQYVRVIGEDIVATELIVPENHRMESVDVAALLSAGVTKVSVRRAPRVALIPTGDELVQPGTPMKKGDIVEFNTRMLAGMASGWGAVPRRRGIAPDLLEEVKSELEDALEGADMAAVIAGSSAGSKDYTYHAIDALGEVVLHGVNIRPGKPVILGIVGGKPVIGLPGFPVAAYIAFRLFARGLLYRMQGTEPPAAGTVTARLSRQMASKLGDEEFVRVKLGHVGGAVMAMPLARGSGQLMSLVRADGILRIPANSEGLAAGSEMEVELMRPLDSVENTIVCTGSHDGALDVLANFLKKRGSGYTLSSSHVGSLAGIMALKGKEAHLAGSHLLDEATGGYNVSYIKKYLPGRETVLVNLVYRRQGLMVQRGNPKAVKGFEDLKRPDVVFVNRQAGAGTRLLTDMHLKKLGMDHAAVRGYDHIEYTHTAVASAVLEDVADTGLGILAAAVALGLDFIPVAEERYDLVIPKEHYDTPMIKALMGVIREDSEFRAAVESLGGYDTRDMGKVMWEGKA